MLSTPPLAFWLLRWEIWLVFAVDVHNWMIGFNWSVGALYFDLNLRILCFEPSLRIWKGIRPKEA